MENRFALVACNGGCHNESCEYGCIGCGICKRSCPSGAAKVKENLSVIDEELCLSCGMCAVKCPRHAIYDLRGVLTERS